MFQKGRALLVVLLGSGCMLTACSSKDSYAFTYSTYHGGIYQVRLSGQKQQILPTDETHKWSLRWSPDQTHLAYVAVEFTPDGRRDTLWVVNADGSGAHSLLGPVKALLYSWEDNSQAIYVEEAVSFERIPFDQDTIVQAYTIDVETVNVHKVERRTELFPQPIKSPDGNWAAWTDPGEGKWTLFLLDNEGNKLSTIYQPPPDHATNGVWSPDSQQLALVRPEDGEIYTYEIDTQKWLKLSSLSVAHRHYRASDIQWSPNGDWLSYTLDDQEHVNRICVLNIKEQNEQCFDTQWSSNQYIWSRNSHYIAYLGKISSGEPDLFVIDVLGGAVKNLTQDGNELIEDWIGQ